MNLDKQQESQVVNLQVNLVAMYLEGDSIFALIDTGETQTAVKMLQNTLRVLRKFKSTYFVLRKFKSTYFDYKSKASIDCADNPWRVQNNTIFIRFDSFLGRCHDILD